MSIRPTDPDYNDSIKRTCKVKRKETSMTERTTLIEIGLQGLSFYFSGVSACVKDNRIVISAETDPDGEGLYSFSLRPNIASDLSQTERNEIHRAIMEKIVFSLLRKHAST